MLVTKRKIDTHTHTQTDHTTCVMKGRSVLLVLCTFYTSVPLAIFQVELDNSASVVIFL